MSTVCATLAAFDMPINRREMQRSGPDRRPLHVRTGPVPSPLHRPAPGRPPTEPHPAPPRQAPHDPAPFLTAWDALQDLYQIYESRRMGPSRPSSQRPPKNGGTNHCEIISVIATLQAANKPLGPRYPRIPAPPTQRQPGRILEHQNLRQLADHLPNGRSPRLRRRPGRLPQLGANTNAHDERPPTSWRHHQR